MGARGFQARPIPAHILKKAGELHERFEKEILPGCIKHASRRLKSLNTQLREELIQEACCNCWQSFLREIKHGRDPFARIGLLITTAVKMVFAHRYFNGQNRSDVFSRQVQEKHRYRVHAIGSIFPQEVIDSLTMLFN